MNIRLFTVCILLVSAVTTAKTITGVLVSGGGVDDMSLTVKMKNGHKVYVYCDNKCGNWFTTPDENDFISVKRNMIGKKVRVKYKLEANNNRIAGPSEEERFNFLKSLKWISR